MLVIYPYIHFNRFVIVEDALEWHAVHFHQLGIGTVRFTGEERSGSDRDGVVLH